MRISARTLVIATAAALLAATALASPQLTAADTPTPSPSPAIHDIVPDQMPAYEHSLLTITGEI